MRVSRGCLLGASMLSLPASLAAQQLPASAPAPALSPTPASPQASAAPDASVPAPGVNGGGYRRRYGQGGGQGAAARGSAAQAQGSPAAQAQGSPAAQGSRAAQAQDAGNEDAGDAGDVIVTGRRTQPGAVIGDIPPEVQLGPADIRSYGVSSIADLLTELAPQTGSVRGQGGMPVVLLDGRRIGSFAEIRDLPTEAIQRVDILPEEVALKYGYTADQRVVNFVLRRRFRAITTEAAGSVPTEGGRYTINPQTDILTIANGKRLNLHLAYSSSTQLLESDRNIASNPSLFSLPGNVVTPAGAVYGVPAAAATGPATLAQFAATGQTNTNPSPYRTLLPATTDFQFNSIYATNIGKTSATLNARIEAQDSRSEQGLATTTLTVPAASAYNPFGTPVTLDRALGTFAPLRQDTQTVTSHLGATFNGDRGKFRYTLTGNFDRVNTRIDTDTGVDATPLQAALTANTAVGAAGVNPFGPIAPGSFVGAAPSSLARSTSSIETVDALLAGPIVKLPAGPLSTSVHLGGTFTGLDAEAYRFGTDTISHISRNQANAQGNFDLPITSRREGFLAGVGDLSANLNVAINQLSDFGTLTTIGYGANWSPVPPVRFIVSVTDQDDAPSAAQLGNPIITTPGVRVFDYVTGQTVTVNQTTGGNAALTNDHRHVAKVGLTLKPATKIDFTLTADYVETHVRNPITSFPSASAAIEAAFPDRFARTGGVLTSIDSRPVNFAASDSHVLRYGFNLAIPLKSKIQKQFEAFRAGKGPNPLAGLFPNGRPKPPTSIFGGTLFGGPPPGAGGSRGANGAPGAAGAGAANGTGAPVGGSGGTNGGGAPAGAAAGTNSDTGAAPTTGTQGAPGAAPAGGPPGGFGGGGGPGGGGFRGGGGGFGGGGGGRGGGAGGRLQFAFYHSWYFEDTVLVRNGGPLLDALNGDIIGNGTGGGQPRHELEGQAGYSNNGLGLRASANYQTATFVRGSAAAMTGAATGAATNGAGSGALNFSSLATFDLRLFADLGQQLRFVIKHPWARGLRLTLAATNLFDSRQRVTAGDGTTPISYQPAYLDPLGRAIRLSLRKQLY